MDTALMTDALDGFRQRLEGVDAADWIAGTPCADWDVRSLVNHVLNELRWIPPLLDGRTIAEVGDRFDGDLLGDDPFGAWTSAATEALAAASQPGAQDRTVHLSFGDLSGGEYLGQVTSDVIIHTWDLARAVGASDRLGAPAVGFLNDFLGPQIDGWRAAGAFGPVADADADADAQARFLAETGRSPNWARP